MVNEQYDSADEGHTERTPLVGGSSAQRRRPEHRKMLSVASIASAASVKVPKVHNSNTIVNILSAIILVTCTASGFTIIPMTRLVEDNLCHRYYDQVQNYEEPIDEKLCKVDSIQSKVAFVFATVGMIESAVGFLAAFPWGIIADRIGRRPVAAFALTGAALSVLWVMVVLWFPSVFPVILVAGDAALLLLGGGGAVLISIIMSMISDVVPEERRATAFMRVHVASLTGNLVSPALASAMMTATGPWPVMCIAVACYLIPAVAFLFVPETLQLKKPDSEAGEPQLEGLRSHIAHTFAQFKGAFSILKSPSLILLLIISLASVPFAYSIINFLVLFVSKRYAVPIRDTGYVQSASGVAQMVLCLFVLPWISSLLMRDETPTPFRMKNEQIRDLSLARWSFGFMLLGFLILGSAPVLPTYVIGLMVMAFGSGYSSLIRSLMSVYVEAGQRSRLFCLVGMVEVGGSMLGQPMLAGLFTLGMKMGGGWIGLPYYGLSAISALVIGILAFVRVPKREGGPLSSYEEALGEEGRQN